MCFTILLGGLSFGNTAEETLLFSEFRNIQGFVFDQDGVPLIGVTVAVKGSTRGTITDVDGSFSLDAEEGEVLEVRFVGYKAIEVAIDTRSSFDITLEEDNVQLGEVVVTALGIERREEALAYAVTKLDGSAISDKTESDVVRSLNGRIAGVNISQSGGAAGSSTNIVIRGNNSATGNNQPLFVVDGIPFDNTTNNSANPAGAASTYSNRALDLDPSDIASISVLKGGAAAALYGSRASNGVIIITTHSGSSSQEGFEVEVSNTFAIENIARLPRYQNKYGQGNLIDGVYTFSSVATESWGPEIVGDELNGGLFLENGQRSYVNHYGATVPYQAYPNNVEEFFETGFQRENSIRMRGGNGTSGFAITLSNVGNQGFIPNTGLNRTSAKVAGNTKLKNGLTFDGSMTYVNTAQDGILSGGHNTLSSINRQTMFIPRSYDLTGFEFIDDVTGLQYRYSFWDNPRWLAQEGPYNSNVNRIYGYLSAGYEIKPWLNVSYKLGTNTYSDLRSQIVPVGSFNSPGQIINHNIAFTEIESNLLLTGQKQVSDDIHLSFIAGQNFNQRSTDDNIFIGDGIIQRGINRISNTRTIVNSLSALSKRRLFGLFGEVSMTYRDFLFVTATGRNDWSSTLPQGNNSYFYPSVSAAVVMTEALDIQTDFLSYLKLRAGFAQIGNDASPYLLNTVNVVNGDAGSIQFPFNGISGTSIGDNFGNANLTPEFTNEIEIGADIRLLNYRLGIDLAFYDKVTSDQIFSVSVPAASGFLTKTLNAGKISNRGIELGIDFDIIENKDINWNLFVAFSKNRSEVIELFEGLDQINPGFRSGAYGNILKVGQPYGVIEGEVQNKTDDGQLLVNATTGLPTKAPAFEIVGDPNPDFQMGITNSISYKSLSLNFLVDIKKGGDILCLSCGYYRGFGLTEETANRDRTFIIPGVLADPNDPTKALLSNDGQTIPNDIQISPQSFWSAAVSGSDNSQYRFSAEAYIFDATVYRLRELSVQFKFPKPWLDRVPFGSAAISLTGRNLWFWAPNVPHIDPEVSTYGAGNVQGVEQYAPPTTKNFGCNLKFTF